MPLEYVITRTKMVTTQLGFMPLTFFQSAIKQKSYEEQCHYAQVFFPWWNKEPDADFWRKTALVEMWLYCPWREPVLASEEQSFRNIDSWLEKAYSMNTQLAFPWREWIEVLELTNNQDKLNTVKNRIPQYHDTKKPTQLIGYRRHDISREFLGWAITIPGHFAVGYEEEGTGIFWWEDRKIYLTTLTIFSESLESQFPTSMDKTVEPGQEVVVDTENNKYRKFATLEKVSDKDGEHNYLLGRIAIPEVILLISILFDKNEDKDWAIKTFSSIFHIATDSAAQH
ncbi:MAG: hypothetical protein ACOCXT_02565 [Candidatus Dojkabacteria bacterium]